MHRISRSYNSFQLLHAHRTLAPAIAVESRLRDAAVERPGLMVAVSPRGVKGCGDGSSELLLCYIVLSPGNNGLRNQIHRGILTSLILNLFCFNTSQVSYQSAKLKDKITSFLLGK